jgi:putative transposase
MPRIARVVIPGCPHHVTQRGNHGHRVFFNDSDCELYLKLLQKYFEKYQVGMVGYVLMSNHTHLILIPTRTNSLAKGVGLLHNDFSRWQLIRQNTKGHLWQSRFFSTPMDEDHFWEALRYIELNPVRAGIVRNAWEWPWSSARAHVTGIDTTGMLQMDLWSKNFYGKQWKEFLAEGLREDEEIEHIRISTRTGRPLGSKDFINKLEKMTGRTLSPGKRGPKSGSKQKKS